MYGYFNQIFIFNCISILFKCINTKQNRPQIKAINIYIISNFTNYIQRIRTYQTHCSTWCLSNISTNSRRRYKLEHNRLKFDKQNGWMQVWTWRPLKTETSQQMKLLTRFFQTDRSKQRFVNRLFQKSKTFKKGWRTASTLPGYPTIQTR